MKILVTDYEADLSVKGNLEFYKKEYEEVQRVIEDSIDNGDYSKVGFYTNVSEYLKFRIRKSEEFLERYMS